MIRRIRLENWRAYRSVELDVLPGTTFLVAPNGVGKSSLLEAVRWALAMGAVEHRPSMLRQGHREATAEVTVDVPGGALVITRSLRARGARLLADTSAALNGVALGEAEAVQLLEETWSADVRFVSRTAFLTEDLRRDAEEPNLRTHLCRAYSLDDLQRAVAEIDPVLTQLSKSLKASRGELSATEQELRAAEDALTAAETQAVVAAQAVDVARAAHTTARAAVEEGRAASAQRAAVARWREHEEGLRSAAAPVLGTTAPETPLAGALATAEERLAAEVEALRHEQAALKARLEAAKSSLAALHEADAACPVCLRELDDDSRARAEELHRATLSEAQAGLARLDDPTASTVLAAVRELARQAAALGPPPAEPVVVPAPDGALDPATPDLDTLVAAESTALAALEGAVASLRETELQRMAAATRVAKIRDDLATASALTEEYRAEALLEAAKAALNATITTVLGRQLEPVAAEVNRRWEAVFPDRPNLHVLPDGHMSRLIDGAELEFAAFSAGEQTVAKLMMRLTTLLATTTVPFCWVDEPLEHLDPISRQLVGSTLAHLSGAGGRAGGLEQIFVTTYEEPLARRLAELQPERVRVQYLRTEPAR